MNHRVDVETAAWTRLYPTQAALDAEFTLDTIPNLEGVRRRRTEAVAYAMQAYGYVGPLPYGDDPDETLLVLPPQEAQLRAGNAPPAPTQIFIHGGFWSSMQASDFAFLAAGLAPFGAALVLVDYPLIPRVRLADVVSSCRKALLWVHRNGAGHGIDTERIFISGNSAGGHLVAKLMNDPACGFVRGGAAISGLYDLGSVATSFRNELLALTPEEVAAQSPLRRASRIAAPLIVAVGGRETEEFLRQSADFAAHAEAGGATVEYLVVPDADHITIVLDHLADPDAKLNRRVRRQMGLAG